MAIRMLFVDGLAGRKTFGKLPWGGNATPGKRLTTSLRGMGAGLEWGGQKNEVSPT